MNTTQPCRAKLSPPAALILVILAAAAAVIAAAALHGQTSGQYQTITKSGTTAAEIIFPARGTLQCRLVGVIATSDKALSVVSIRAGTTAYAVSATNAGTGTTVTVLRTNGLAVDDVLVIQTKAGKTASGTIASISRTNLTLSAAPGVDTIPGDSVFKLGPSTDLKIGAASNVSYQGESIKAADPGRPLRLLLDGTSACVIDAASVKWE